MTAHTGADFAAEHHRDLATIASLRAQLAAANDTIARVRALKPTLAFGGAAWIEAALVRAALTPEAPR